jgi:hypothetical protein
MRYPSCFRFWIEQEITPGTWTTIDMKAGHSTLEAIEARLGELRAAGEPWSSRRYRIVTPEGDLVEPQSAPSA